MYKHNYTIQINDLSLLY